MIDKSIYKITITGIAANNKTGNKMREAAISMYWNKFSLKSNVLNLREKSGISETSMQENIAENIKIKYGFKIIPSYLPGSWLRISGKETIINVFAGVGKPIKEVLCLVSMLNFASLKQSSSNLAGAILFNSCFISLMLAAFMGLN